MVHRPLPLDQDAQEAAIHCATQQQYVNTDSTTDIEPSWDTGRPTQFPAYLAALKRWIYKQGERFKPLIAYGYVNIKGYIYCMSDNPYRQD